MVDRLKDKVAVITGSGRGIGRGIAVAMANEGARVVVNDLGGATDGTDASISAADEAVAEILENGGVAVASYDSVATHEGADNIIKTAVDNFGGIDILVNNAGIVRDRMLWNMTDDEWDAVVKTHLYGHFYCTRAAVIQMREAIKAGKHKSGRIITCSSHSGIKGNAGQCNYSAAKMGVLGFTYSCALALWRYGITTNAVVPRAITRITDSVAEDKLRQWAATRGTPGADTLPVDELKKVFLGGVPEAVAPLVCWLASDDTQHINGQVFVSMEGRIGVFCPMDETKLAFKDGIFDIEEVWRIMPALTAGLPNPAA